MQSRVAAVLVTHNSQRWIAETIASVLSQTQAPVAIVVVDDRSTDNTINLLEQQAALSAIPFYIRQSTSSSRNITTRIAGNFVQGVQVAADLGADLVALGDHDDTWQPKRIARQCELLDQQPQALMVASDGNLVASGQLDNLEGTLRGTFPVPIQWPSLTPVEQLRYTLRRSIATGGASMLRPRHFAGGLQVPSGWLHDRWWSLVAVVRGGMVIDEGIVINYLIQGGQQVGLATGGQDKSGAGRLAAAAASPVRGMRKLADLHEHLRPLAQSKELRAQLSWLRLVRNLTN
ncbi:MAG: glycosyltransferase [Actinomycetota bacterium]|nr:glycosyltransferase [Actinomycetota bacterium]